MQYKDYYKTLGVSKDATADEIKKAYRSLVKKYHPDKNQGDKKAEDKFKEVSEAYEVLGDAEKRNKYDTFGSQTNFSGGYDFDPSKYGFSSDNVRYEYHNGDARSDFFNAFFSDNNFDLGNIFRAFKGGGDSGGYNRYSRAYKGDDIESIIEITPEEGHKGASKRVSLRTDSGIKSFNFTIPKGVKEGEKIRLKNQGNSGVNGGDRGDLYMKVKFSSSDNFTKHGKNIHTKLNLYPWDAALGTKMDVKTLDGKIKVTIPEKTQSGKKIRVSGKGYKERNSNPGDMIIEIKIVNPVSLTPKMKKLFEKMKEEFH